MRSRWFGVLFLVVLGALAVLSSGCSDDAAVAVTAPDSGELDGAGGDSCDDGCNDGDSCTRDRCQEGACVHEFDETFCCTPDECDIEGFCFDNRESNPENPCQACVVVEDRSRWSADDSASCEDDNACSDQACIGGECVALDGECHDDNPCTDDVCDPNTGECTFEFNAAPCEDGDLCTVGDHCAAGVCRGGTARSCDDHNTCTRDSCDSASGCVSVPDDDAECDDGDLCTSRDTCSAGECVGVEALDCDDDDLCTADGCDAVEGCVHHSLASLCADANPCTDERCEPTEGCVYPFNTVPCDDGSACTTADTCSGGVCSGTPLTIDDLNVCTDDVCDPLTGVSHEPNTLACDDHNACTAGDVCDGAEQCTPGETVVCDDDNFCTDDTCDETTGCVFTEHTRACDDGDACTVDEVCDGGECLGQPLNCDDGRACTVDSCDASSGCRHAIIASNACRPNILVDTPQRAETIAGILPPLVPVRGRVISGGGPLVSFTLNGAEIALTPVVGTEWEYTFDATLTPQVGANILSFLAIDDLGSSREVVQAFHWSTTYDLPDPAVPGSGAVVPGLGFWLGQASLDDKQPPPPTDIAEIFRQVLLGFDLSSFFDQGTVLASSAGYDIYLTSLVLGDAAVSLDAIDGGIHITAALVDITGDLLFDCTSWECLLTGDSDGDLSISDIVIEADAMLSANPDHTIAVDMQNVVTTVGSVDIHADNGLLNFLIAILKPVILATLVPDLEAQLNTQLQDVLGPMLANAFGALAFNMSFDLPRLDGATDAGGDPITIPVALASDFENVDFEDAAPGPQGGALELRAWATTPVRGVETGEPFDSNLGIPKRVGCGVPPQMLVIPRQTPIEIVFADDTFNQIFRAAWWGGLMEFPVGPSMLGGVDLESYGITNLSMFVSGLLPPLVSDCGPSGDLRMTLGDLEITINMELFGQPMDLLVYVSLEAPITLAAQNGELALTIEAIDNVQMQVEVLQEELIGSEPVVTSLLETEVVPMLGSLLGGGAPLMAFPLPEIDLSDSLGMPPGTLTIAIETLDDPSLEPRIDGNTIVYGQLR